MKNQTSLRQKAQNIAALVQQLEQDFGLHIIINDRYFILKNSPLDGLKNINAWHLNAFCLKIKQNNRLHRRCIYLKQLYDKRLQNSGDACSICCYCGVRELAEPVIINGVHLLTVSFAEMLGPTNPRVLSSLARQTGTTPTALLQLKRQALVALPQKRQPALLVYLNTLTALLYDYLSQLPAARQWFLQQTPPQSDYVCGALDFIVQNLCTTLNAQTVAAHCHVSVSHLQHLFLKRRGHGIAQEIKQARLTLAAELLCTTHKTVREIAYFCGFSNSDYFSTAFRAAFSQSPLKYRKSHQSTLAKKPFTLKNNKGDHNHGTAL